MTNYSNVQRVLLVEDNTVERMRMVGLLTRMAYEVIVAKDAPEAWDALRDDDFDIVLSDWELPTASGVEICETVSRWALFDRPYFIMMSGRSSEADHATAKAAGVDDYLDKPVSKAMLLEHLQRGEKSAHLRRVSNGVSC